MRFDSGEVGSVFDPLRLSDRAYETANPFDASATAGAMFSAHFRLPYFDTASSNPRTVPGTPDERHPSTLSFVSAPFASRNMFRDDFPGARSRKSMKVVRPSAMRTSM